MQKILVATVSGIVSSSVGIPLELVNTRMQMDRVLSDKYKRSYRNVFHGLYRVWLEQGLSGLYTGGLYSIARGAIMAIGQNAVYDQVSWPGQVQQLNFLMHQTLTGQDHVLVQLQLRGRILFAFDKRNHFRNYCRSSPAAFGGNQDGAYGRTVRLPAYHLWQNSIYFAIWSKRIISWSVSEYVSPHTEYYYHVYFVWTVTIAFWVHWRIRK